MRVLSSRVWTLAALCVVVPLSACAGGDPSTERHASAGAWKQWSVTPPEAFGSATTLVYVTDIVPPTSEQPWIAVGYLVDLGGRHPKAWTSRDGATWTEEDLPPSYPSADWDRPFQAFRHEDATVVFGLQGEEGGEGVASWNREADGTWTTLPNVAAIGDQWGFASIADVAAGPDGLVAVATRHGDVASNIHVLRSSDGRIWTVQADRFIGSDANERIDAFGLVGTPNGELIVGRSWPSTPPFDDKDGEIWLLPADITSSGGRADPGPAKLGGAGYQAVQDVVAFDDRFVAVGLDSDMPVAWVSNNGRDWTAHAIESVSGGASKAAVVGGRLVVVGRVVPGPTLAVWTSADGRSWKRVQLPEAMTRLSPVERETVVSGPDGEIAIVASNDVESEIYIGRP